MADKFIQMSQRNTENTDWDNLFPSTKFETAGGTATAITVTIPSLADGVSKTFVAKSSNSAAATTINGKHLYKPNTTTAPTLIAGKAYTVWYSASNDCFFIKASAEGNATVADVLAGKIFSNGEDVGLIGIATIESLGGKKWASGTLPDGVYTVNDLLFTPSAVIVKGRHNGESFVICRWQNYYVRDAYDGESILFNVYISRLNTNGFTFTNPKYEITDCVWIAIE
jgi:hypothetical protein